MRSLGVIFLISLAAIFQAGCAGKHKPELVTNLTQIPVCQIDLSKELESASGKKVESILAEAEQGGCWERAYLESLKSNAAMSEKQLTKGLQHFNRQQTYKTFAVVAEKYLLALVEGRIVYGEDQQRWLEAYSRYAIRAARSQESAQLRIAQQVCWRLDRPLYTRLFE